MALSVITEAGGAFNVGAFGMPFLQYVTFQSSKVSIVGDSIQLRIAAFANTADDLPSAQNQTICYTATMPSGPVTVNMLPTSGLHPTKHIYKVRLAYFTQNRFQIEVRMILKMDETEFWTNTALSNLNRLEKNIVTNPAPDNNDLVSVYSAQRELRIEATHFDGVTAENAVFQKPFSARFFCESNECCEEFDCLNPAIEDISFQLFRDSNVVTNFSAFDDTTLYVTATKNTLHSIEKYYVAIYRRDTATNSDTYWNDLSFNYAEVFSGNLGALLGGSPFDFSAFVSGTDFTQIGSSEVYEASIVLDSTYFTIGGEYRAFVVIKTTKGEFYSCNTANILADQCPDGVTGDIISSTVFHDKLTTIFPEDRFINVATRQRIRIEVEHDKLSYNAAINAANLPGDFNDNILTIGATQLDHIPTTTEILSSNLAFELFNPNTDTLGISVEFRIPESWDNSVKYIVLWYKFKLNFVTRVCLYEVRKIICMTLTDNDEDVTNHFTPTVKNDAGDVIENLICDTYEGGVNVCFDEVLSEDFTFIPIIRATTSGDFYDEEDAFVNTELPTLHADEITSTEDETSGDGQACFIIDPTELHINTSYQVGAIFIPQTPLLPPSSCVNIDLIAESLVTGVLLPNWVLQFTYTLVGLTDFEVLQVVVIYEIANALGVEIFSDSASGVIPDIKPTHNGNTLTGNYMIQVNLRNGCLYFKEFTLQNIAQVGDNDIKNIVLTPT